MAIAALQEWMELMSGSHTDLGSDVAVEEEPDISGALDIAGSSDEQHPDRHQEAN